MKPFKLLCHQTIAVVYALSVVLGLPVGLQAPGWAEDPTAKNAHTSAPKAAPVAAPAATQPIVSDKSVTLPLGALGDADGYTLKTVKTERRYYFARPRSWNVLASSNITVHFQHGAGLLAERSSLNILVNNRLLKAISLSKANATASSVSVAIPANLLKDQNSLVFQVDQHYTNDCEDPYSAELWTTLLPETKLVLNFASKKAQPNLAQFPYPLFDELSYGETRIGYVAPAGLSDESLSALGVIAARVGQAIGWRPAKTQWLQSMANDQNLVLVGTPQENPAIAQLQGQLPTGLGGDDGVVAVLPHPGNPSKVVLVISGSSPKGVLNAARTLAQNPTAKLLSGSANVVKDYQPAQNYPSRVWPGWLQRSGDTLGSLGLETQTARGMTAQPIYHMVKLLPDFSFNAGTKATMHVVYSYGALTDTAQTKLEVLLNGKSLKSIALNKLEGENLASFDVSIPVEELHSFNPIDFKFHLAPDKFGECRFVSDAHLWGTIHNTTSFDLPGELKAPLPDVGLLNDGGFPLTLYQDLNDLVITVPDAPSSAELNALVSATTRLGRLSKSSAGIELDVVRAKNLNNTLKTNNNVVVIDTAGNNPVIGELRSKAKLLIDGKTATLHNADQQKIATLNWQNNQGILEEVLSPWTNKHVALVLTGANSEALNQVSQLLQNDTQFGAIGTGNLVVTDANNGPRSITVLKRGEARFLYPDDTIVSGKRIPTWALWVGGFFMVIGILSILRFVLGA